MEVEHNPLVMLGRDPFFPTWTMMIPRKFYEFTYFESESHFETWPSLNPSIFHQGLPGSTTVSPQRPPSKWPAWPLHVAVPLAMLRRHNHPEARSVGPSRPFRWRGCMPAMFGFCGKVNKNPIWSMGTGVYLKPRFSNQNQHIHVEKYTNCMFFFMEKPDISTINTRILPCTKPRNFMRWAEAKVLGTSWPKTADEMNGWQ